jgi:hypothetical protein
VRHVRLMLVAALLIGAAAACSDDDDGGGDGTLSESEFQDQANAECEKATEKDPIDLSSLIENLDALVPPESMQDEMSEMLTQFRDYQKAINRGETPSTETVRKADSLADDLGLAECAEVLDT